MEYQEAAAQEEITLAKTRPERNMTDSERDAIVAELGRLELRLNDDHLTSNERFALLGAAAGLRWFLEMDLWEKPSETFHRLATPLDVQNRAQRKPN